MELTPTEMQMYLARLAARFAQLWSRWQDESQHEDFADYVAEVKKALPPGSTYIAMTKRPFRVVFDCSDGKRRYMRSTTRDCEWGIIR